MKTRTKHIKHLFTSEIIVGLLTLASTAMAVDVAPPPSSDGKMVYDTARQEAVLYGVILPGSVALTQTWVWNGGWHSKTPVASPPGVKTGALAYDAARQRTVFFGGAISPTNISWVNNTNTWAWDGTNWSMTTPTTRPKGRWGMPMAYDSLRQQVVLFGGSLATTQNVLINTNDTWVWNGTDWALKNPASHPSVRQAHGLAFDAARGQTVLFGGMNNNNGSAEYNDTWLWDGTNWTKQTPSNSPPVLTVYQNMTYDSARQEVVLFGGGSSTAGGTDGTWVWNGTNWSQKLPVPRPTARAGHMLTFDPSRGKVVMFGGENSSSLMADTWLWDGTNWQSSDLTLSASVSPSTVFVGSNLIYNVVVTNKGPSVADEVSLVEELPASVGFVSAFASQGSCSYANGAVTCNLGSVPTNTTVAVSVTVTPLAIGTITNVATVLCSAELNPSNNVAKAAATVVSPPTLTVPLTNQTVAANGQIVLGVGVNGSSPLSYQWFFNGTNSVSTTQSLTLTNLDWSQAGFYTVVVSNPYGSVTNTAILSLNDIRMYAGIRIAGVSGANYQVDTRNSLNSNDGWVKLTNFALPYSPYLFIDESSPDYSKRFYRVTSP